MKKYAVLHEPGDIVTLAGTRFVVLDVERRGSLPDSLFLLALESVGTSEFGSSNNYAESDLKKAVDKWLEDMGKRDLDNAKLIPRELDVMLQSLTNWLSYAAIIVAVALALCQLIYFIIEKKENHHEHL